MHHQIAVRELHRAAHLLENLQPAAEGQALLVAVDIQRNALHVLHHEVRKTVVGGAAVEQAGNAGVDEVGENLALGTEAADDLVGVHAPLDQLQSGLLLELLVGSLAEVDRPHASPGQTLDQPVGTDHPAQVRVRNSVSSEREDGLHNEVAGLVVRIQIGEDLTLQSLVSITGPGQMRQSLGGRQVENGFQNRFDLLPAFSGSGGIGGHFPSSLRRDRLTRRAQAECSTADAACGPPRIDTTTHPSPAPRRALAARSKSRAGLRAALFRRLGVRNPR